MDVLTYVYSEPREVQWDTFDLGSPLRVFKAIDTGDDNDTRPFDSE